MARVYLNELKESVDIPLSFTNRLLQQFEFCGASPYTMGYARIACTNYKVSTTGERTFNHCLTNLPVFVATDDHLQFGFDEQSLIRNRGVHMFEYEHLLLGAALVDCLPEAYVAAILYHLGQECEDEDRVNPSLSSWQSWLRCVYGLVSSSEFALMIDDRMQLDPYRVVSGHSMDCNNLFAAPQDFARALRALNDLSIQGSGELTIIGDTFLGWFAAFAEFFLSMNVHISSRDGHELYKTRSDSNVVLKLIFVDDVNELTSPVQAQSQNALSVKSRTDNIAHSVPTVPFTGRVVWEALLPRVFENSFHKIAHQESKILVKSVAGIARLFQLLAQDPEIGTDIVSPANRENTAGFGIGLIQTLCNFFPELRHLQGRLERLQTITHKEAIERCDEGAKGLIGLCGCTICYHPFYSDQNPGKLPQSFCLLALMETIVNLGLSLSRITVVSKLYPSRAGILCIYQKQCEKLLLTQKWDKDKQVLYDRAKILFLNDWNANDSRRLQSAAAIFSGSWPINDLPDNLVALSHEGICTYLVSTQRGKRKDNAGLIRVQCGTVSWRKKSFVRASLGPPTNIAQDDYSWEAGRPRHLDQELYFK